MSNLKEKILAKYAKLAENFEEAQNKGLALFGVDEKALRKETIDALCLKEGDTVLEIGCGTGSNFSFLEEKVGDFGKIIGVDISLPMLKQAEKRIKKEGWKNIELLEGDLMDVGDLDKVHGVLCTFSACLFEDLDAIMIKISSVLVPGGKLSVVDVKLLRGWKAFINPWIVHFSKIYGGNKRTYKNDLGVAMQGSYDPIHTRELKKGVIYLASGVLKE